MSIATVVTRGYGTASYADVSKLPTLGYSSATAAPETGDPDQTYHARPRGEVFHARPRGEVFHAKGR